MSECCGSPNKHRFQLSLLLKFLSNNKLKVSKIFGSSKDDLLHRHYLIKKTTRVGGIKNCRFWDDIVYGRPLVWNSTGARFGENIKLVSKETNFRKMPWSETTLNNQKDSDDSWNWKLTLKVRFLHFFRICHDVYLLEIFKICIPVWVYICDGHWEISIPFNTWLTLPGIQFLNGPWVSCMEISP